MTKKKPLSPSEYYRSRRPEYFSDSIDISEVKITKEVFALELEQITTNQKQDAFELFARKLAEKLISPNLIPQTGPTGGGDGKVDFDTYNISATISDRWFIPDGGWTRDEKWAFAISAKKDWKPKLLEDVIKILGTERDYTQIFFITNQKPSGKKRKEVEDELKGKYGITLTILDGNWILDKVFSNDLTELAATSLNLSSVYQKKEIRLGKNDTERLQILDGLESRITSPNRYFETDYQLVEDCLEAASLSRSLEKPKDEVMGKFDRTFRFAKKLQNENQLFRVYYQRAWTNYYWYEDFVAFYDDYIASKELIAKCDSITSVEHFVSLQTCLLTLSKFEKAKGLVIDLKNERTFLTSKLNEFVTNPKTPCGSLIAQTYLAFINIMDNLVDQRAVAVDQLKNLKKIFTKAQPLLDYPFEAFKSTVAEFGNIFPNETAYDELWDSTADIAQKRNAEHSAGADFLRRGGQKLDAGFDRESIIYFGKAVTKLAKEESKRGMYLALLALGEAYKNISLYWAANVSYSAALSISFKTWTQSGKVSFDIYRSVRNLCRNELVLGRIPSLLTWFELFRVLKQHLPEVEEEKEIPELFLLDGALSVRLLKTAPSDAFKRLPDILIKQDLWNSQLTTFYVLGQMDKLQKEFEGSEVKTIADIDKYFAMIAKQPFVHQIVGETALADGETITFSSKLLGCQLNLVVECNSDSILIGEGLIGFLEGILATSLERVVPNTPQVVINLKSTDDNTIFELTQNSSSEYTILINYQMWNVSDRKEVWNHFIMLFSTLLTNNFFVNNPTQFLNDLFMKEEVTQRVSTTLEHCTLVRNVLGTPKLIFSDWLTANITEYENRRETLLEYETPPKVKEPGANPLSDHANRDVISIIDDGLWNKAMWQAFGFYLDGNGLCLFLGFRDAEAGKKIFEGWMQKYGSTDKDETIKLTLIRDVNVENRHIYRIHVSSNVNVEDFKEGTFVITATRYHEMTPLNSDNINKLLEEYKKLKVFRLCPAYFDGKSSITPFFTHTILKKQLFVKSAWEIGLHDLDRVAIRKDDNPFIPPDVTNAPILEVLKNKL